MVTSMQRKESKYWETSQNQPRNCSEKGIEYTASFQANSECASEHYGATASASDL